MRSDLIETFKIVNINPELFFQPDEGDRRGHDHKLLMKRFRLNVRKYAFLNRVIEKTHKNSSGDSEREFLRSAPRKLPEIAEIANVGQCPT